MAGKLRSNKQKALRRNVKKVIKRKLKPKRGVLGRDLTNGVAAVPRRAFGNRPKTANGLRAALRGLDATSPVHLPLPRATGPYTPIRVTRRHSSTAYLSFFGTFATEDSASSLPGALGNMVWINVCGLESAAGSGASTVISAANAMRRISLPMSGMGQGVHLVPSAVTIQIVGVNSVTNSTGVVYVGRSHSQLNLSSSPQTFGDLGTNMVSFMAPRMCSASKLALRGVKCSSYPLDMTDLADFRDLTVTSDANFTWDATSATRPEGFAPIFVFNPSGASLEILITLEWRVRFGIDEVAASTHTYHTPSSDGVWASAVRASASMGHGVVDIVEDVAAVGAEAGTMLGVAAVLA